MQNASRSVPADGQSVNQEIKPVRVQLSRKKGWRMPPNTVKVTRPGPWGNMFIISPKAETGTRSGACYFTTQSAAEAVELFRHTWERIAADFPEQFEGMKQSLRGKNLACWCKPGEPCHADVLLEIANAKEETK